jgi:hypothetical protein
MDDGHGGHGCAQRGEAEIVLGIGAGADAEEDGGGKCDGEDDCDKDDGAATGAAALEIFLFAGMVRLRRG